MVFSWTDDEVVEALAVKANRRLAQREMAAREQGRERGLVRAIEAVCALLGLALGESERAHMRTLDAAGLEALLARLQRDRRWPQ